MTIGVAVIGAGMAGRAHAAGYRAAGTVFGDRLPPVRLVAVADVHRPFAADVARRYGFERAETGWEEIVAAPDIHAVSVAVANDLHRPIVEALMAAGKHVLCEKPLAGTLADGEAMARCAADTGRIGAVGFVYRRSPAVSAIVDHARRGLLGPPAHFEGRYWCDYACDPRAAMSWRYRGGEGSGVLGDLGSHLVDLAELACGPVLQVDGAVLATRVTRRPLPLSAAIGHAAAEVGSETAEVQNEDLAAFTARFASGAVGSMSVSRLAFGHPNTLGFTLFGERGGAAFDLTRPAEFGFFDAAPEATTQGWRTVLVGPRHPYVAQGLPVGFAGVGYGLTEYFTFQARAFLEQVAGVAGLPPCASFDDGLRVMRVLEAVVRSARQQGAAVTPG